jgi:hypothetical protein
MAIGPQNDVQAPIAVEVAYREVDATVVAIIIGQEFTAWSEASVRIYTGQLVPSKIRTSGPLQIPGAVMMSAIPSPVTSPAASCTPPVKAVL